MKKSRAKTIVEKGGNEVCHEIDCGHEHSGHHGMRERWHYPRGCCYPGYRIRRFLTREESITQLEEHLKNLQAEAKGVEERITELKK